jgi:hypothetical protein
MEYTSFIMSPLGFSMGGRNVSFELKMGAAWAICDDTMGSSVLVLGSAAF